VTAIKFKFGLLPLVWVELGRSVAIIIP